MALGENETGPGGNESAPETSAYAIVLICGGMVVICLITLLAFCRPGLPTRDNDEDVERARTPFRLETLNRVSPPAIYREWKMGPNKSQLRFPWSMTCLTCVICLEPFQSSSKIRCLPCGHLFHSVCILMWFLKRHNTCPICKFDYTSGRRARASRARSNGTRRLGPPLSSGPDSVRLLT
ncbi:uncharacterized protein P884DRAFT_273516 [Thermothelomyces heterothallicus CBS 202.75]|uniref:uncharacterized protein n=1 Tax=Thermothelomyces heterothallicus CBS 202.75 TaxID=1149848 RepID=UPI00374312DC